MKISTELFKVAVNDVYKSKHVKDIDDSWDSWYVGDDYSHTDFDDLFMYSDSIETALGTVSKVRHWGGENEGSDYGYVLQVNNQFFKVQAYYSSWDSTDWSAADIFQVELRQRQIVHEDFERIEG